MTLHVRDGRGRFVRAPAPGKRLKRKKRTEYATRLQRAQSAVRRAYHAAARAIGDYVLTVYASVAGAPAQPAAILRGLLNLLGTETHPGLYRELPDPARVALALRHLVSVKARLDRLSTFPVPCATEASRAVAVLAGLGLSSNAATHLVGTASAMSRGEVIGIARGARALKQNPEEIADALTTFVAILLGLTPEEVEAEAALEPRPSKMDEIDAEYEDA
jgi:hypothetical protein